MSGFPRPFLSLVAGLAAALVVSAGLAAVAPPAAAHATTPTPVRRVFVSGAPSGVFIRCNVFYTFTDSNGSYNIQRACGATTAPWGFRIAPALCAIAVGYVTESGMRWTRNGVTQPTQAPHVVPCNYVFHGTYNPALGYDHLTYGDGFTFAVNGGHASLSIHGNYTFVDF